MLQAADAKIRLSRCCSARLTDEERGLGALNLQADPTTSLQKIAAYSSGDARSAYNVLEVAAVAGRDRDRKDTGTKSPTTWCRTRCRSGCCSTTKPGEEHYNLISALHKSVRNSDPDAALYWLGRMLEAGEDPLYIARRVVRMAVEDIGLADPECALECMAARGCGGLSRHARR